MLSKNKKQKNSQCNNKQIKFNINVTIDKQVLKEAIIESYKEIDKGNNKKHISTETLKIPMDAIFFTIVFVLGFFALVFLITAFYFPITQGWNLKNLLISFLAIVFFALCVIFCIIFWKTRVEISKETNRNYIATYFSSIISFIALIIALISCLKE